MLLMTYLLVSIFTLYVVEMVAASDKNVIKSYNIFLNFLIKHNCAYFILYSAFFIEIKKLRKKNL